MEKTTNLQPTVTAGLLWQNGAGRCELRCHRQSTSQPSGKLCITKRRMERSRQTTYAFQPSWGNEASRNTCRHDAFSKNPASWYFTLPSIFTPAWNWHGSMKDQQKATFPLSWCITALSQAKIWHENIWNVPNQIPAPAKLLCHPPGVKSWSETTYKTSKITDEHVSVILNLQSLCLVCRTLNQELQAQWLCIHKCYKIRADSWQIIN